MMKGKGEMMIEGKGRNDAGGGEMMKEGGKCYRGRGKMARGKIVIHSDT